MGVPLACPATDSADRRAGAAFRMIRAQDTTVATLSVIHATIENGMIDKTTAGMYGTSEYPYKAIHSTSVSAFMFMQHVVVIHKTVGKAMVKVMRIAAACTK